MTLNQELELQKLLKEWRDIRHLSIESQKAGLMGNVCEELSEWYRATNDNERVDAMCDVYVFCMNSLKDVADTREEYELFYKGVHEPRLSNDVKNLMENPYNDVFIYMLMTAVENIAQKFLGFDFYKAMLETIKEISSRTGSYDSKIHKFVKDKSPEAKAKWYSANYDKCRKEI